jgi:hypothetical protein
MTAAFMSGPSIHANVARGGLANKFYFSSLETSRLRATASLQRKSTIRRGGADAAFPQAGTVAATSPLRGFAKGRLVSSQEAETNDASTRRCGKAGNFR